MKKFLIIGLIVLVILGAIFVYLAYALRQPHSGTLDTITNPFDFGPDTPGDRAGLLPITTADGAPLYVPDFTKEEQPPIAGPETGYQVAGAVEGQYQILYFPDQSYFLVSLLSEPLGEVRLAAEQELRTKLMLSDDSLCNLNLEVRTDVQVNESYAGSNLGLSFCPGAVKLP